MRRPALLHCALLIAAALFLDGCSLYRRGLGTIKAETGGAFVPVRKADFPTGDPLEGASGEAQGSRILAYAAQGHDAVADAVRRYGIPDAVAITGGSGLAVDLAYLDPPLLRSVALVGFWRTELSERALTEAEIAQVDPESILQAQTDRLRDQIAMRGRLEAVGRSMLRPMSAPDASPPIYGLLLVTATPAAARLYGGTAAEELVVAWVDPAGPQRDQLRLGDRVVAADGAALAASGLARTTWSGPVRLTIERDGARSDIVVEPERLPLGIRFVLVDDDRPNAQAAEGVVGVTTGLMRRFASDDVLAAALGHELAHITLGHTQPDLTIVGAFSGLVRAVMLPLEIVQPGTVPLFTAPFESIQARFNRYQERDADRLGLHYAKAAGYDPAAALVLLDALQGTAPDSGIARFLDIHPPYPERRTLIEGELAAQP